MMKESLERMSHGALGTKSQVSTVRMLKHDHLVRECPKVTTEVAMD